MLEVGAYSVAEMRTILGVKTKQEIDRKLDRYLIKYRSSGRAEKRVYEIMERQHNKNNTKEIPTMSKIELLAKIELLNKYEAMIEEMKGEADTIRNSIKAEMEAREVEELIAGQYIVRWTSVLSNRFDSTSFKKVLPDLYKAYTKQVSSRRFSISV